MTLELSGEDTVLCARSTPPRDEANERRIELIVDGRRRPVSALHRVLLRSGPFWSGYRLERVRVPATGRLEQVSAPHHRIVFVAGGTGVVRYRACLHEARQRLSPGTFCFIGCGYEFEQVAWKGQGLELVFVDLTDCGVNPNPVDAFGRTDALFDMRIGIFDARVATLIDLMCAEIEAGCPTGGSYGEALSLALASRVASLCATMPGAARSIAMLSAKQLGRLTEYVSAHLSHELTIERLATIVNISAFHFALCFKHTTGLTPHHFVTRERIMRARHLLMSTDQTIGQIAMSLGFASQSHFADVYRNITGRTPRHARNHADQQGATDAARDPASDGIRD